MKLIQLLEATAEDVERRIPIWAKQYFGNDLDKTREIVSKLIDADPTRGKYTEWILKQHIKGLTRHPEDNANVIQTLTKFEQKKNRLEQKDVNRYDIHTLRNAVDRLINGKSSKNKIDYKNLYGVSEFDVNGPYITLMIEDPDSLAAIGKGTRWCTREDYEECMAEDYIDDYEYLFVVLENGYPVMQYTPDYEQIMDVDDKQITDKTLLSIIPKPNLVDDDTEIIFNYIKNVIGGRWPEAEPYLMNDPEIWSYYQDFIGLK